MTPVFPIGLKLAGKRCLVFGFSPEQATRAAALMDCGARVLVIAPQLAAELRPAFEAGHLEYFPRGYKAGDLSDAWLAVQVNCDPEAADLILAEAERERVFFCAVDQPASSYFHLAQARAGALLVAVSTNGRAPALARRLRQELQRLFDAAGAAQAVEHVAALREDTAPSERRLVMQRAMQSVRLDGALSFGELSAYASAASLPPGSEVAPGSAGAARADTLSDPAEPAALGEEHVGRHSNVGGPSEGGGTG